MQKRLESFGAFIIAHWMHLAVLMLVFSAITLALTASRSVVLSEKEFRCAESSPDGLGTRCDVYVRRVK